MSIYHGQFMYIKGDFFVVVGFDFLANLSKDLQINYQYLFSYGKLLFFMLSL